MRQISLLPAGCHQCDQSIVYASESKLVYSSKLALYVVNPITFTVEKIISTQTRSLLSMSVNPNNDNFVACSGSDGIVCVWDLSTEECTVRFAHPADILAWDPHKPNNCAIIVNRPKIQLFSWDMRSDCSTAKRLFVADYDTVVANVARWNPHIIGLIAMGGSNGVVYIYNTEDGKQSTLKVDFSAVKDRATPVTDLQWDRLSAVYMIVAYKAFMSLWDTESNTEVHLFDRQSTGISCIAWMDWTAGNFISANSKTGVVKVWNASQKQPLDSIRIHSSGITSIHFALGSSRMICGCTDGTVLLYHMLKHQVEFSTCAGHTDTVFDCALSPISADVLGTCSYDSTVKIWNVPDMSLQKSLYGPEGQIIYSCSWSPDARMIAASTIAGIILIFEVESGRELVRYGYHKKASYGVAWNQKLSDVILSTSADGTAVVIKLDIANICNSQIGSGGAIGSRKKKTVRESAAPLSITKYDHPASVFGCEWCPHIEDVFSTACQDSIVRVFRYRGVLAPLYQLAGHTARVFNASWSPLLPGLLASSSDDHLVLVWELPRLVEIDATGQTLIEENFVQPIRRLAGHTSNVRAVSWNFEHRQVLISGSWDATIRVWNVATGVCLQIITDHVADVYSVASHRRRPFTYVSCSRDTTLRVWEIEGFAVKLRMKALADGHLDGVLRSAEDRQAELGAPIGVILNSLPVVMEPAIGGTVSAKLGDQFRTTDTSGPAAFGERRRIVYGHELALMYRNLFDFFCGANGCVNLWDCVIAFCRQAEGVDAGGVSASCKEIGAAVPEHLLISAVKSEARQLESVKMGVRRGDITGKVEENLRKAAAKFAQTGDFAKYCSLMIELGDWKAALAMAPAVSTEYWQHLMFQYAGHLEGNMSEDCVPYYLGCGQDSEAVRFYMDRKESTSAMVVAKMSESRTDLIPTQPPSSPRVASKNTDGAAAAVWTGPRHQAFRERTDTEDQMARRTIRQVALHLVDTYVAQGKPISAAAHLVSIGEVEAAVTLLLRSDEPDLAFAVAECCSLPTQLCAKKMAEKAEHLQDIELSVHLIQRLNIEDSESECAHLLARHTSATGLVSDPQREYLARAGEARDIGKDEDAISNYALAGDMTTAAAVVVDRLSRHVHDPLNLPPAIAKIFTHIRNVRADQVDVRSRAQFLAFVCWFGAHKALRMGFWDISWGMIRVCRTWAQHCQFPLSQEQLAFHELCIRVQFRDSECLTAVDNMMESFGVASSREVQSAMRSIRSLIKDAMVERPWSKQEGRTIWSMHARALYGILTGQIEEEVRRISSQLSLPILPSTLPAPPAGVQSLFKTPPGHTSCTPVMEMQPVVVQGSLLPVANQSTKGLVSCVTGQRAQGAMVMLSDNTSIMSKNEMVMWKMVNPYSPMGSGEFLE